MATQTEIAIDRLRAASPSDYLLRSISGEDCPAKQSIRCAAINHIIQHHGNHRITLLSFPSTHWRFEHQLYEVHRNCTFIGLERDNRVFLRSLPWMPGQTRVSHHERRFQGRLRLHWAERSHWSESLLSRAVHMDVATFLLIRRTDVLLDEQRQWWTENLRRYTAVWLDFTSPISTEVERAIPEIPGAVNATAESIPVIVSVMKGRELPDITGKMAALRVDRAEYINRLLFSGCCNLGRTYECTDVQEYTSSSGTAMVNVFGVIRTTHSMRPPKPQIFSMQPVRGGVAA